MDKQIDELADTIARYKAEKYGEEYPESSRSELITHYKSEARAAIQTLLADAERRGRIRGRRIQAEATLDKWTQKGYGPTSEIIFRKFLGGQVDAHKYEEAQLRKGE